MRYRISTRILASALIGAFTLWPIGAPVFPHGQLKTMGIAQAAILIKPHYIKIEKRDSLSKALHRSFPVRSWKIWGKDGAVAQIAAINPHIKDVNKLRPGMIIDIGKYADLGGQSLRFGRADKNDRAPSSLPETQPTSESEPEPQIEQSCQNQPETLVTPEETVFSAERYGIISVASEFSYSKIDSTDKTTGGTATYLSNLSPGLRLGWRQHWSNRFQTSLNLGVRSETYIAPANFTLDNSSHTMTDIGVGTTWVPFEGFSDLALDGRLGYRQELFARATSLTSTALDAVAIPQAMAGARLRVIDLSPFSVTLHAHELFLFSSHTSNYSINSGNGTELGVTITQDLSKSVRLSGDVWHFYQSQSTTIATQNRTDIGMTLGVSFRFDPFAKPEKLRRGELP